MKVIALFVGIGGFDLGVEHAGMEVVAHVGMSEELLAPEWPIIPKETCRMLEDLCLFIEHRRECYDHTPDPHPAQSRRAIRRGAVRPHLQRRLQRGRNL